MKKLNTRSTLFLLLIVASLVSYIYLNTITVEYKADNTTKELELEDADAQQNIILPDVLLIKKVVDAGKRLIPAS